MFLNYNTIKLEVNGMKITRKTTCFEIKNHASN